jgi:hypothetical protein
LVLQKFGRNKNSGFPTPLNCGIHRHGPGHEAFAAADGTLEKDILFTVSEPVQNKVNSFFLVGANAFGSLRKKSIQSEVSIMAKRAQARPDFTKFAFCS